MSDKFNINPETKVLTENTALEIQIKTTDKAIEQLVYQLYGLTDEEIRIVEGE